MEGEPITPYGSNAYKHVQWRDTSILTSPLDRQARQMQYIQTVAKKLLADKNPNEILNLYNTAQQYTYTNLDANEVTFLATTLVNKDVSSLDPVTLQGEMTQNGNRAEFNLDTSSVHQTVLDVFYHEV